MVLMMFGPYNTVSWVLGPLGLGLFGRGIFVENAATFSKEDKDHYVAWMANRGWLPKWLEFIVSNAKDLSWILR